MRKDVERHVNDCEQCGANKHSTKASKVPVLSTDVPVRVSDKLQVDFVGPFGISTAHVSLYALQIQDALTTKYICSFCADHQK